MAVETVKPPATSVGVVGWLRKNLFSTWYNALLTVLSLGLVVAALRGTLTWVFTVARWGVVTDNLKLFLVGQYPVGQLWRVWLCVALISLLAGMTWGLWRGFARTAVVVLAAVWLTVAVLPVGADVRRWSVANLALLLAGFAAAVRWPRLRRAALIGWALSFPLSMVLLRGLGLPLLPLVPTAAWGGLLLTMVLAVVSIVASFPLGVLLALARAGALPIVRYVSIAYIELVRGVPLVTILFMSQIMLPLFLPPTWSVDRVVRAMVGLTLFTAAYLAEVVRGGLQAVPHGQVEAARALGLSGLQTLRLIVLPQALRAVIPPLVSQFIALFKDTSLVAIVGLLELVNIGRSVLAQTAWLGRQREVFVFIAAVFWVFTFAMSSASRHLEARWGVGKR